MKIAIALCILLLGGSIASAKPIVIHNGQEHTLSSADGKRDFRVFIVAPDAPAPEAGYPVIYILDGNSILGTIADEVKRQLHTTYKVPAVVVAIGYPGEDPWNDQRRDFDLTPRVPDGDKLKGPGGEPMAPTGGADLFLEFIEQTVKPVVERDYKIDRSQQTLAGHSFGGLFTLHTFFTRPETFQNFVAMSPSIWFADNYLLTEEAAYRAKFSEMPDKARLLITVGGCEQTIGECDPAMQSSPARDAWLGAKGRQVDNAVEMHKRLSALKGDAVNVYVIPGEHHVSVLAASVSRAVRFALSTPIKK
ncbi:MAG: alpha/beta hydrolase [Rhodospirillaceae bacterium]|nr:alpha/beta hydrolase [Rhodospirillaceae bacterium]